uniref:A0956 protein n=1 Tax=Curvibasidium rogersii TaxID=1280487 RepID=A0A977TIF7_9BASI|nr:A0956 protein [Curvibasidium rogersii]
MEAVWTRFQPISFAVDKVLASGVIGDLVAVRTELSTHWKGPDSHRMVNPDLAGGALLDLGPYAWVWLALPLLQRAPTDGVSPLPKLRVAGSIIPYPSTGVDAVTTAVVQFPQADGRIVHGTMSTSLSVPSNPNVATLTGTKGFLNIAGPTYRPTSFSYSGWESEEAYDDFGLDKSKIVKTGGEDFSVRPGDIWGFAWEADEVARCVRDGKKQSARMPLRETVLQMEVFDEIRRQNGLVYPEALETLELAK